MYIFGRGNDQIKTDSQTVPDKEKWYPLDSWYAMLSPKPTAPGRTYEAQPDGTWLDVTTPEEDARLTDDANDNQETLDNFNTVMEILRNSPTGPDIAFMILYDEVQEYLRSGTVGELLIGIVQTSGKTGTQLKNFLEPLFADMRSALGRMIGRSIK